MPSIPVRLGLISISSLIVVLALAFPSLNILQALIRLPFVLSLLLVLSLTILAAAFIRSDARYDHTVPLKRRRRALRPLAFTTPSAWSAVLTRQSWETSPPPTFFPLLHRSSPPSLNARFDSLFALIRSTFILPWYTRISPSPAFPNAIEVLIREILSDLAKRAEKVDWPIMFVSRLLPLTTTHLQHYRQVEHLAASSVTPSVKDQALPLPLPAKPHPALAQAHEHLPPGIIDPAIESHFRTALEKLLGGVIPEKDRSEVVSTLVREIVLGAVLMPVFEMLCDGDFWNRQIDEKGGRYLHEQKQVDKFLTALSSIPRPAPVTPVKHHNTIISASISADSTTKQFDTFLKSIPRLKTLGEARRLRADVEREQRAAGATLAKEVAIGDDERIKRGRKYVKRLESARGEIDARILVLSKQQGGPKATLASTDLTTSADSSLAVSINLYAVLSDPSSLAYWLEYMERRSRSRLVQFWLTVEGFKDPLEAAGQNSALESTIEPKAGDLSSTQNQTLSEDVTFLFEAYFADPNSAVGIPAKHLAVIKEFSGGGGVQEARRVKHAIFSAQKAVYEEMEEEDWDEFKRSELFLKAVTDLSRSRFSAGRVLPPRQTSNPELMSPKSPSLSVLPPPPIHPTRQNTTPLPVSQLRSPLKVTRKLTGLVNGVFSPSSATVTPAVSVSTTPPTFERGVMDRKVSAESSDRMSLSTPSLSTPTPPQAVRRSSHLDILMGEESLEVQHGPRERDKLFGEAQEDEEDPEGYVESQRMEAIQAALNEIIASDDLMSGRVPLDRRTSETSGTNSMSASLVLPPKEQKHRGKLVSKSVEDLRAPKHARSTASAPTSRLPSNAERKVSRQGSLPKLHERPAKLLFDDDAAEADDLFDDEEADVNGIGGELVQLAAPGDLQLSVEIARLQDKLQELVKQEHLLDNLIRQAELTGSASELKILRRSHTSVRREQRTAIFQKAQFEQQEEENRLVPGRTRVEIPTSVVIDEEKEGKQVVRYSIEVKQVGEEGQVTSGWMIARRYNEFWELDKALREWAQGRGNATLNDEVKWKIAELPGKRLVPNLSANSIESRRIGLQKYLQSLLASSIICESPHLRSFLSRSPVTLSSSSAALSSLAPHNLVKSLYKTMATSLDDALLGPSMLDLMSTTLSRQLNDVAEGFGGMVGLGPEEVAALLPQAMKGAEQMKKDLPEAIRPMGDESGMGNFTAPICDLFVELFDLKENNWLRRQAIVVILQQFLGGTIERSALCPSSSSNRANATSPDALERSLANFQETLWPGGERRAPGVPRTEQEQFDTRLRASRKLALLIPDVAANMIGRSNARRAARRVFGALQDKRLNQHFMLCILDEVFNALLASPR